ncbi:RecB-like helicase [Campylobacter sp. MIT 99-7217]|uniref:RecB-like helicase n=1 Tax=Campylobacter sp. MIT 99-7217 TaxID=535091 RepID=UPI00115C36E9|nr:RecB-like helicase [Campylobacter sp. MIT 99-7217]TQR32475.1 RecB-like helicase [Campylobacter sp. MIT 99-7217]
MSEFKPFLALEASAGSGKTFALSVRFIALMLKGARINEILALTFSNKAANEMKERIISTFLNLHKEEKSAELNELCKLLAKEKEEILSLRDQKKARFFRAELKISTFDSFFAKVLRAFSLNLGLMSDFAIRAEELEVKNAFIANLNEEELSNLAFYLERVDKSFFKDLEKMYQNIYDFELTKAVFPNLKQVNQCYLELKSYALNLSTNSNYQKNFQLDGIESSADLASLCEKPLISKFENDYFEKIKEDEHFMNKRALLIEAINSYAKELEAFKISQILRLLKHFEEVKIRTNKAQNILSFNDVAKNTLKLTQSESSELIYFRLDGAISHLLIDEFQDTNLVQYEILKPLIAELLSGEGTKKERSFFYVGDKKQSIYRFRSSKKELFDLLQSEFKSIELDKLDTNYRSHTLLVDFVNEVFMQKYPNYQPQKSLPSKKGGFVKIATIKEESKELKKELIFEAVFEELVFLKERGVNLNKLCILCWKNADADELVEFLKTHHFKAFTQSDINLANKASVALLLSYAKYCVFGDELYLEQCLSLLNPASLMQEYSLKRATKASDLEEFKKRLFIPAKLSLRLYENPASICLYLIKKLGLDLSDIALIQFLEYASKKENFLELLFEPCGEKILNEENLGISIMTLHKSKGLEFESVILLDSLSTRENSNKDNLLFEFDIEKGLELRIRDKFRSRTKESDFENFIEKSKKNDAEDKLNTLYVAMTRAKNNLIIIKNPPKHFSYFNSELYLNLDCQQRGEIIADEHEIKPQKELLDELEAFEKIPLQELSNKEQTRSKEIFFGEAFHFLMQHIDIKEGQNLNLIYEQMAKKYRHFLDEQALTSIFKRAKALLFNEDFQKLIKNKELFKEQSLSFEGQIKQLDLLCVGNKEVFVIDYKTGQSFEDEHIKQLSFYKRAITHILKKDTTRAFLFYCLEDEIKILEV